MSKNVDVDGDPIPSIEIELPRAIEDLTFGQMALYAILTDRFGVDGAEFLWPDENNLETGCYRLHPYQWQWFRCPDQFQVDGCGRAVGKSERLMQQICAFPFSFAGEEAVLVTPEGTHADAITQRIEVRLDSIRLYKEMTGGGRGGITHRPFKVTWRNGARFYVRLPQRDGRGVKGCVAAGSMVLTEQGWMPVEDVQVGDRVWTHRNRWQTVNWVESFQSEVVELSGDGVFPVQVTPGHRMFGRTVSEPGDFQAMQWMCADDLLSFEVRHGFRAGGPGLEAFTGEVACPEVPAVRPRDWWRQVGACVAGGAGSASVAGWVAAHGDGVGLPPFLLGLDRQDRCEVLEGCLGVGGSVSRGVAVGVSLLASTLARDVSWHAAADGWVVRERAARRCHADRDDRDGLRMHPLQFAAERPPVMVHNVVTDDGSYLVDNVFHHNTHPVLLHVDEGQDVTNATYDELPEVLRRDVEGSMWQIHGVSKGVVGDFFWKATQPESKFTRHQITAMHRPDWNEQERADRVEFYGSAKAPGYLRNVLGEAGPSQDRIFVLDRLYKCVDSNDESDYNTDEYYKRTVSANEVAVRAEGSADIAISSASQIAAIQQMLDLPRAHTAKYKTFWAGMDIGLVSDPSEIVVAAEYTPSAKEKTADKRSAIAVPDDGHTRFKVLARITVEQLPSPLQAELIMWVIHHYRPKAFCLDRTGVGLPVFQELQRLAGSARLVAVTSDEEDIETRREKAAEALTVIKGYNFSEKIPVAIDEQLAEKFKDLRFTEMLQKAGIFKRAKDAATDVLRDWVDTRRYLAPHDSDIINQMNGQTWGASREPIDAYGNRRMTYSTGVFHLLDGLRMLALGQSQQQIEDMIAADVDNRPAVPVLFGLGD